MDRRTRVFLVVAVALAAAIGVVAGAALVGKDDEPEAARPKGVPPVLIDVGVRQDRNARLLRQAARLHSQGRRADAAALFGHVDSPDAQAAGAIAAWPDSSLARLEALAADHPSSGAVQFHLGMARFWSGDTNGAIEAWRTTRARAPDTAFAVRAGDLLFRKFPPGNPTFVPSFRSPAVLARLSPPAQFATLRRRARRPDARAKLLYGVALQRLERPVSAEREFAAAARLAPQSPDALVAAAVGRYTKEHPEQAFSRLGPLARRFPQAATVRFHLGLLLLWIGDLEEAKRQLARAARMGPPIAREAKRLLDRLEAVQQR